MLVQFACPACSQVQGADVVALARGALANCTGCRRRLTLTQVSRAIERTRRLQPVA
jgi:hypothetical protein